MAQNHTFRGTARATVRDANGAALYTYQQTAVVTVHRDGSIALDTGGWFTPTTARAMNQASNEHGLGFHVFQRRGAWFVDYLGSERPFVGNRASLAPNATHAAERSRALAA